MRPIVKNIIFAVAIVVAVAVVSVVLALVPSRTSRECADVSFVVNDYEMFQFVKESDLRACIESMRLSPVGMPLSEIDLAAIEAHIMELSMVKSVAACFTTGGELSISVTQRVPKFRMKSITRDFYVDTDRKIMATTLRSTAHVPVVSGVVDEEFLTNDFFDFIDYIQSSSRWSSAFSQFVVEPGNRIVAIPRVGDFVVEFGPADRYKEKLNKLAVWYDKVPRYYSWDAFSVVNLQFRDQVVCTYR